MKESSTTSTQLLPFKKKALKRVLKLGMFIAVYTDTDTCWALVLLMQKGSMPLNFLLTWCLGIY